MEEKQKNTIHNFKDFTTALLEVGFSIGGQNGEGLFTLCERFGEEIRWHTEEPDTDPWEWRIRVLKEREDIAYGKFFFKKSGYITREWYPYFYAVRRGGRSLNEAYQAGTISRTAKKIYELLEERKELPAHLIRQYGDFDEEEKGKIESALTELQMKFYLTVCGTARKKSQAGEEYGWSSIVYCRTEVFFGKEILQQSLELSKKQAYQKIREQILCYCPEAKDTKISKFILAEDIKA